MTRLPTWLVFLALAVVASPAWADCPLDLGHGTGWVVFSQHFMIAFRPDPPRLESGDPLALILNVCTKGGDAAQLVAVEVHRIDDSSPGKPDSAPANAPHLTIVPGVDGRYRAEGLLLTEPGRWEVTFDVRAGADSERLSHELDVR
jgi:hypothetical protein